VNAQLASSIKHDGEKSPFMRVDKGIFALKNSPAATIIPASTPISKQGKSETLRMEMVEMGSDTFIGRMLLGSGGRQQGNRIKNPL
jgi:hypothetical protein